MASTLPLFEDDLGSNLGLLTSTEGAFEVFVLDEPLDEELEPDDEEEEEELEEDEDDNVEFFRLDPIGLLFLRDLEEFSLVFSSSEAGSSLDASLAARIQELLGTLQRLLC